MTTEPEPEPWQHIVRYGITWAGWIGLLLALSQCHSGEYGPSLVVDQHRFGLCWPSDPPPQD